jgi:hypothetical protein
MDSAQMEGILKLVYNKDLDKSNLEYVEMEWTPREKVYELLKGVNTVRIISYVHIFALDEMIYTLSLLKDVKKLEIVDGGFSVADDILVKDDKVLLEKLRGMLDEKKIVTKLDFSRFEEVWLDPRICNRIRSDKIIWGALKTLRIGIRNKAESTMYINEFPASLNQIESWRRCEKVLICGNWDVPSLHPKAIDVILTSDNIFVSDVMLYIMLQSTTPILVLETDVMRVVYNGKRQVEYSLPQADIRCKTMHILFDDQDLEKPWGIDTESFHLFWRMISPSVILENVRELDLKKCMQYVQKRSHITLKNCLIPGKKWLKEMKEKYGDGCKWTVEGCTILEDEEKLWSKTLIYQDYGELPSHICFRLSAELLETKKKNPSIPLPNCGIPFDWYSTREYYIDLRGLGLWTSNEIKKCSAFSDQHGIGRYLGGRTYKRSDTEYGIVWLLIDGYWPGIKDAYIVESSKRTELIRDAVAKSKNKMFLVGVNGRHTNSNITELNVDEWPNQDRILDGDDEEEDGEEDAIEEDDDDEEDDVIEED